MDQLQHQDLQADTQQVHDEIAHAAKGVQASGSRSRAARLVRTTTETWARAAGCARFGRGA